MVCRTGVHKSITPCSYYYIYDYNQDQIISCINIYNILSELYSLSGYISGIRLSGLYSNSGLRYSLVDLYSILNKTLMENILLVDYSIFIRY